MPPVIQDTSRLQVTRSDLSRQVLEHGQASHKGCPDVGPKKGAKCQQMDKAQSLA